MIRIIEERTGVGLQYKNKITCPHCEKSVAYWTLIPACCPGCHMNLLPFHGIAVALQRRLRYYLGELEVSP